MRPTEKSIDVLERSALAPWKSGGRQLFDAITTRVRRFFRATDLDEQDERRENAIPRLPDPLPQFIRSVAFGQIAAHALVVGEVLRVAVQIAVIMVRSWFGGPHFVPFPFEQFAFMLATTAVSVFGIVGARKILRRDARGIVWVRSIAIATIVFTTIGMGFFWMTLGLNQKFLQHQLPAVIGVRYVLSASAALVLHLWTVFALFRYRRELDEMNTPPLPVSQKRQRELAAKNRP